MSESTARTKKCSYCGEEIPAEAGRCSYCGSLLDVIPDGIALCKNTPDAAESKAGADCDRAAEKVEKSETVPLTGNNGYVVPPIRLEVSKMAAPAEQISTSATSYTDSKPLGNGAKVLLTAIACVIPGLGQLIGIIAAIVFMNSEEDQDRKSFGSALLTASLIFFVLSFFALTLLGTAIITIRGM